MKCRVLFLILLVCSLPAGSGCLRESEYKISRQDAIDIAVQELPESLRKSPPGATTIYDENFWTVYFMPDPITKEDLGWGESLGTTFENQGHLPEGEYSLLGLTISRRTGEVVKRMASDSVLLGGPGTWNNEPAEERYLPVWVLALSIAGGVAAGALIMWLVLRRKTPHGPGTDEQDIRL
jgi:hypothetical protein